MTYERLLKLMESRPRGPRPFFTAVHLVRFLELVESRHFGRKELAQRLKVGEGSVRTMTEMLRSMGLADVARGGVRLSREGVVLLSSIRSQFSIGVRVPGGKAFIDSCNVAIAVKRAACTVTTGVEQRDAAIIAGSTGASTFIYASGRLVFPGMDSDLARLDAGLSDALLASLKLEEGDVIVVGSAADYDTAALGAIASAASLL